MRTDTQAGAVNFRREIVVAMLSVICAGVLAFIGWTLLDRLHWAARETQIDAQQQDIDQLKKWKARAPTNPASEEGLQDLRDEVRQDHTETMDALRELERRFYDASLKPRSSLGAPGGGLAGKSAVMIPAVYPTSH